MGGTGTHPHGCSRPGEYVVALDLLAFDSTKQPFTPPASASDSAKYVDFCSQPLLGRPFAHASTFSNKMVLLLTKIELVSNGAVHGEYSDVCLP